MVKDVFAQKSKKRQHIIVLSCSILSGFNAKNTLNTALHQNKNCALKIQGRLTLFLVEMNLKCSKEFNIKFLYAKSNEDALKWICHIVTKSLNRIQNDAYAYPENALPNFMSNEEAFLLSFSLNPIVISFLLSSKTSLACLMSLKLEELCDKYPFIPKRFLEHFHSGVYKNISISYHPNESDSQLKADVFQLSPALTDIKTGCPLFMPVSSEADHESDDSLPSSASFEKDCSVFHNSSLCGEKSPLADYPHMSLEDIDRSYQELCLQDVDMLSDLTSKDNIKDLYSSYSSQSHLETSSLSLADFNDLSNSPLEVTQPFCLTEMANDCQAPHHDANKPSFEELEPNHCLKPKLPRESILSCRKSNSKPKQRVSFMLENDSPLRKRQAPDLSQFILPKRRKFSRKSPVQVKNTKLPRLSSEDSSLLSRTFRIQKGQSSKMVSKDSLKENKNLNSLGDSLKCVPLFGLTSFQATGGQKRSLSQSQGFAWNGVQDI